MLALLLLDSGDLHRQLLHEVQFLFVRVREHSGAVLRIKLAMNKVNPSLVRLSVFLVQIT